VVRRKEAVFFDKEEEIFVFLVRRKLAVLCGKQEGSCVV
jgi:hypothetical protein